MNWQDGVAYAHAVAKGEINVCNDVRLACQRFINQLENKEWEWVFDHGNTTAHQRTTSR